MNIEVWLPSSIQIVLETYKYKNILEYESIFIECFKDRAASMNYDERTATSMTPVR